MAPFCTSPLWDWNYTWYSEYPRLSSCFENTVLAYTPAMLLIPFGLVLVGRQKVQHLYGKQLSWTTLGLSRFIASLLLTLVYAYSLMYKLVTGESSWSSVTADLVHAITFAVTIKVQDVNRRNGIGSSMLMFFFWLVSVVCRLPECFRHIWELFSSDGELHDSSQLEFAVWASAHPMVVLQLLLSCWADARHDARRPYLTASPVSFLLFSWLSPLILKRSKRCIHVEDIYAIPPDMTARRNYSDWRALWNKELNIARNVAGIDTRDVPDPLPSMFRPLWKLYWKPVAISCILATLRAALKLIPALLLHQLIGYMAGTEPTWKGILYVIGIVGVNFGSAILAIHIDKTLSCVGINAKTVMVAAIYRKTVRLSSEWQRDYTIGELVNLISVDADRIFKVSTHIGYVACGVPLIVMAVVLLWQYLGVACLAGISVMLVIMPVMAVAASLQKRYQTGQMKLKDKRLSSVAEMLSSVKVLKLFAWENMFIKECTSLRLEEMAQLKRYSYLIAFSFFILNCSSCMVSLASFVTYVLISDDHILDPSTVFVSLMLIDHMQYPMFIIPDFISNVVQTSVSMRRIRKFLLSSEVDERSVGRQLDKGVVLSVRNATLAWSNDKTPMLRNVNLSVKTGQLIAIVGPVGSGKSSLLSALLGNLLVRSGSVDCIENVAYAPQCPWIQNKSVRENVLFTSTYDAELYEKVLKVCCLESDLRVLPGGDLAEIGERGINLSGGQRQRVSLARAAYQMKDLYLFDDPLSALDAHIGACVFRDLIGPRGMLKETTRILVTHNLSVLNEVDYIVVMRGGSIVESGNIEDLKQEGSVLSQLLKKCIQNGQNLAGNENTITDIDDETTFKEDEVAIKLVEEETMEEGSISPQVYGNYIRHTGPLLLFVIACYAVYIILGLFVGIWLSEWTNDFRFPEETQNLSLRNYRIKVYVLLFLAQAVTNFLAVLMLWKVALSSSTRLHQLALNGVMRAPLCFFDSTPSGRILNRFSKDIDQLDAEFPTAAHFALDLMFLFASTVVLVCLNIPIYILIVTPVFICLLVLRQRFVVPFRQVKRLETVTRSPVNNHFLETLMGLSTIRSYGVQNIFLRDNDDKIDTMQTCTVNGLDFKYWIELWMDVVGEVLVFFMLLLLVTSRNTIATGRAGLLVSYTVGALSSLSHFLMTLNRLDAALISAERLNEYRCLTPEGSWASNFIPTPDWPGLGAVSFKSYSTRYRSGLDLVLREVNLDVRPGEKLGLVGRTGAGKSTITLSLFRIMEAAAGKIVIDGVDIAVLGLHDLRSRITIIPQDPVLFQGTLRFNLDPAGQRQPEELWWALDRSHLGDVFRKTGGLDFDVAEGGTNLSAGQRQLVCLARAMLRKTKVVVLDEATASVDMETDLLVQQTLSDVMSGCTVLTVAHRIHTVLTSDRIIVMDQGRIVEVGSPTELLADETSRFYAMAREAGVISRR